ncbi:MAG: hypothetical protein ACQKBW_08775, partial [Puniceicoccales bacterium]
DQVLGTAGSKLYRFDPTNKGVYSSSLASNPHVETLSINYTAGVPTVIGDYLLIASRSKGELSVYKLSEDRSVAPALVKKVTFKGNSSRPISDGNRIYLPLGYGGLASFELAGLTSE